MYHHRQERFEQVKNILSFHPEYITDMNGIDFVPVYLDEYNVVHGFSSMDIIESGSEYWIAESYSKLQNYNNNNGNVFFLYINYANTHRMPSVQIISEDDLSKNLVQFCMESGVGIHYISFEDYYEWSEMLYGLQMYPFIQFKDGVRQNVPYSQVTIADFLRTFPNVREHGLRVNVNGVDSQIEKEMED